jgi:hypothetical protein
MPKGTGKKYQGVSMNKMAKIIFYLLIPIICGIIGALGGEKIGGLPPLAGEKIGGLPIDVAKMIGSIVGLFAGTLIGFCYTHLMASRSKRTKLSLLPVWGSGYGLIAGCLLVFIVSLGCGICYWILGHSPETLSGEKLSPHIRSGIWLGIFLGAPLIFGTIPGLAGGFVLSLPFVLYKSYPIILNKSR